MRSYLVAEMKGKFDCLRASLPHPDLEMIQRKSIRLIKCQETLGSYVIERGWQSEPALVLQLYPALLSLLSYHIFFYICHEPDSLLNDQFLLFCT